MTSAFFYGTLMHPRILKRVIGNDGSYLEIRPALLLDYTRHKVKGADYPGIVPYLQSKAMFGRDLGLEEKSVRGSLVVGLSDQDVELLDIFEGDEYTRELVHVHPVGRPMPLNDMKVTTGDALALPELDELETTLETNTYVWCKPPCFTLEPSLWMFDEFVKENAWKWIGLASETNQDYAEVDRRRAMQGKIVRTT